MRTGTLTCCVHCLSARLREQLEALRARQHAALVGERACSPRTEDEDEGDSDDVQRGQWGKKHGDGRALCGPWWDGGTPMVRPKLKKGRARQQWDRVRLPQQHAHSPPPAPTSASVLPWSRTGTHMSPQPPSSPPSPHGDEALGHEQADAASVPPQQADEPPKQADVAVAAPGSGMRPPAPDSWSLPRLLNHTSPHPSRRSKGSRRVDKAHSGRSRHQRYRLLAWLVTRSPASAAIGNLHPSGIAMARLPDRG